MEFEQTRARLRIFAVIQARMASTRLPGKVLLDIGGEPMLVRVVERARRAKTLEGIIVATTTDASDDGVVDLCRERGYPCYRGSVHDVLDRYYQTCLEYSVDILVRLTADCPIIDGAVIDETVNAFLGRLPGDATPFTGRFEDIPYDFAANRLPPPWKRTYPIGLDTEVCSFPTLELVWKNAQKPHQREHVMPFLYEDFRQDQQTPSRFRICLVNHDPDYGWMRWTVDTPADLQLLRRIYTYFNNQDDFSWRDVLNLFEREPALVQINATVRHKNYRESEGNGASGDVVR
jgi:spore coat polysaccharide biosynthesis protein SpsF